MSRGREPKTVDRMRAQVGVDVANESPVVRTISDVDKNRILALVMNVWLRHDVVTRPRRLIGNAAERVPAQTPRFVLRAANEGGSSRSISR
jgi:hypothetical protein